MLAARNKRFRIAAALGAVANLIGTGAGIVRANYLSQLSLPTAYAISGVMVPAAALVGAVGWMVVALAFGPRIDWRRLVLGGTIVATTWFVNFAAEVLRLAAEFPATHPERAAVILDALAVLLTAIAGAVIASGLAESRRGRIRARRLRLGAALIVAESLCGTAAGLFLHSHYSRLGFADEVTISALIGAVAAFGFGIGALVFARAAERPLGRREAGLVGAAVIVLVATLVALGSEVLLAIAYRDSPATGLTTSLWLEAGNRFGFAVAILFVALGARTASAPEPLADDPEPHPISG